jgi:flagellar motor protein MotB
VLHYLLEHPALNAGHLSLPGYGPFRAVAANDTEDGRALNRRVEIVIWARQSA